MGRVSQMIRRSRFHAALSVAALTAVSILLATAGPVSASRPLTTAITDGGRLFISNQAFAAQRRVHAAGARAVRLIVNWNATAPNDASRPAGFDAANPADPHYSWGPIDEGVRAAAANHLSPILTVVFAPRWAERSSGGPQGTNSPDPHELGLFATALARRYSGQFQGLPRVRYYMAWQEGNYSLFLNPLYVGPNYDHATRLLAPAHYRPMVNDFAA